MNKNRVRKMNKKRIKKTEDAKKNTSQAQFDLSEIKDDLKKHGWGKDTLSKNIEAAFYNIGVSFLKLRPYCECLTKAAEVFDDTIKLLSHSDLKGFISISLFARAYSCFLGAVRLSCSGQISETWVLLRACIENSLYAFYIDDNPKYATVWIERRDSETHKKKCRKVFTIGNIWKALEAKSHSIKIEAKDFYENTIDWGAHPNELTVFTNLEEKQDGYDYKLNMLNPNDAYMRQGLCAILSTVTLVLKIFALIYPDEFKQPNLTVKIDNLNKQTQILYHAALEQMKDADKATEPKAKVIL